MSRAEKWTVGVSIVAVVVAVLAWWFPDVTDKTPGGVDASGRNANASPAGVLTRTIPPSGSTPSSGKVPLHTQTPQSGNANIVGLPRELRGQSGYAGAVPIACPSNQVGDQVREVTYPLRSRYLDFASTVRPYFAGRPDVQSEVSVIVGVQLRDGTLNRQERGRRSRATAASPGSLAVSVESAEELTLQVRCEEPDGVVVLVAPAVSG